MFEKFTKRAFRVVRLARSEASRFGTDVVESEHLLLGILNEGTGAAVGILDTLNLGPERIRREVETRSCPMLLPADPDSPFRFSRSAKESMEIAAACAIRFGHDEVGTEHLLLGILVEGEGLGARVLSELGLVAAAVHEKILEHDALGTRAEPVHRPNPISTPALDAFGRDLTQLALERKLDPVIGRLNEIERVIHILSRRRKNNPALIGEPGVGKTAIVEGLAQVIAEGNVPKVVEGRRLVMLDLPLMVAGTKYRGQFEERLKSVMKEVRSAGDIILFIDEMHTMVGAGGEQGGFDVAGVLKPALSRGEIQVIGASTLDDYRMWIERDAALERRFQSVVVTPPNDDETLSILRGLRERFAAHHHVHYTEEALEATVALSARYVSDRCFPDKAIDVLDEAGARSQLRSPGSGGVVDEDCVAECVATMTGVPVARVVKPEAEKLLSLEKEMNGIVLGQEEAVSSVVSAYRRSRAGMKDPRRPIGSFLFLGPTGVGKTSLAKSLARTAFGDEQALLTFDMSEYAQKENLSRLVEAPPGLVGHEEGGQLTESIRRRPFAVLLLDEIEKAHPDCFHILLQVMEEGRLTDALGRTVDFRNALLILTSNIGTEELRDRGGPGFGPEARSHSLHREIEETFRPEFLNRLDDVVVFRPLTREPLLKIAWREVRALDARLARRDLRLHVEPDALEQIVDEAAKEASGARAILRAIEHRIENPVSEAVLAKRFGRARTLRVYLRNKGLKLGNN